MCKKRKELYAGICLFFMAVFYMFFSYGIVQDIDGLGPRTMPHIIGIGLGMLSLLWIMESAVALKKVDAHKNYTEQEKKSNYLRVMLTFLLISCFGVLLKPLGFCLSAFGYLVFQITLLAPRERLCVRGIINNAVIAMVTAIVLTLVFSRGLGVPLPRGSWHI